MLLTLPFACGTSGKTDLCVSPYGKRNISDKCVACSVSEWIMSKAVRGCFQKIPNHSVKKSQHPTVQLLLGLRSADCKSHEITCVAHTPALCFVAGWCQQCFAAKQLSFLPPGFLCVFPSPHRRRAFPHYRGETGLSYRKTVPHPRLSEVKDMPLGAAGYLSFKAAQ